MTSENLSARRAAESALRAGREAIRARDLPLAYQELTQAHVLGQRFATIHVRAHWAMLNYGLAKRDAREVAGQLIRLVVAGPSSLLGAAPQGNIGWARVSMFKRMDRGSQPNDGEPKL